MDEHEWQGPTDSSLIGEALGALGLPRPIVPETTDLEAVPPAESTDDASLAGVYRQAQAYRMIREAAAYWRAQGRHLDFVARWEDALADAAANALIRSAGGTPPE